MSEIFWINKLNIKPKKNLGQNFLIDTNISRKITKLVQGQLADPIIEIGPGTGSLTNELLKDNYRIKAVEIDKELVNLLSERFGEVPNIEVIHEDAMNYDYNQLTGPWPQIHRYVVMLQDEVAERMVAMPNTKQYGSLSILTSLFTNTKIQFNVSKNCFEPKPKILSTVVTIQRETLVDEALRLKAFEISKVAFQQKRKKIKTALSEYIDEDMAEKLSLNLDLRPQELTPEDYLAIAESIQ